MTRGQLNCFYHPNREAVEKCERCNRLICLEDKITHRVSGGIDRADSVFVYCPVCYNTIRTRTKQSFPLFLGIICLCISVSPLIGFGVITFMIVEAEKRINEMNSFPETEINFINFMALPLLFILVISFIMVVVSVIIIISSRKSAIKIRDDQGIYDQQDPLFDMKYSIQCFQCGAPLHPNDSFCPSCGDSTKDEFFRN